MRIGINVPNELLQRVKAISPEVNVSQICREALESRAAEAERIAAQVESDGLEEHILRFAQVNEVQLTEPNWKAMATLAARDWVRAVNVDLWFDFWDDYDANKDDESVLTPVWVWIAEADLAPPNIRLNPYWNSLERHSRRWYRDSWGAQKKAQEDYNRTWLAYVLEVRRRLDEYNEAEYQKWLAKGAEEVAEAKQSVELPPRLVEYYELYFGRD